MARPHDTPTGPNEAIRNLRVDVLSDSWFTLRRATFEQRSPDGQRVECWLHGPELLIPAGGREPLQRQRIAAAEEA